MTVSGFLRSVKNPTATGTRIMRKDRHNRPKPIVGEKVCGVVTPLLVTSTGVPVAINAPQIQLNKLAHPQTKAVIKVRTIPRVLFCIYFAP